MLYNRYQLSHFRGSEKDTICEHVRFGVLETLALSRTRLSEINDASVIRNVRKFNILTKN